MGVLHLTTFIKEHETNFFLDFKLQNTKLIIDGSNLLYFLQNHYEEESVYGGNYDHLFKRYNEFFKTLLKCNVTPVVVFDGAYDPDNTKLDTILKRLDDQFEKVKSWKKMEGLLPVLSKITLCQVLVDLNIAHISCIYEADREIAVLANKWNCPVVSNDSDFYVYSLHGGSISMACLVETARRDTAGKYYVPAKLYQFNIVLKELFKMENDEYMFPVFATLVGNDYFDPSYMTLECPKNPTNKLRCVKGEIDPVVEWMRRSEFTSGRTALEQISRQIPDNKREQFETSVNLYLKIDKFSSFDLEACLLTKYSGNNALLSDNDTKAYECEVLNNQNHAEESRTEHCTKAIHRLAANCSSIKSYTADNHQVVEIGNSSGHFARTEHREEIYVRKLQNSITKQCLTEDIQAQSKDGTSNQSKTADHLGSFEDKGTANYKVIYRRESLGNNGVIQSVDKSISSTCISEHQESLDDIHRLNVTSNQLEQLENKDESADVSKEPENIILRDRNKHQLPSWFVRHAIECNMDCSFILNIAQNHRLVFKAQAELIDMKSSFECSKRIRDVIYRLVLTNKNNYKSEQGIGEIDEYHRKSSERLQVKPNESLEGFSKLPCLETIPEESENEREAIVFATFGASLTSFENDIDTGSQLLILMLSLWVEHSNAPECHLHALIIGMIALHIVNPTGPKDKQCQDILKAIRKTNEKTLEKFRRSMEEHFSAHEDMDRQDINTRKFIHNVSQFQAVYLHTWYLNQLLLSPVCIPSPSVILNSTFAYNMFRSLEQNAKPKEILCGEESPESPLCRLFTDWIEAVENRNKLISDEELVHRMCKVSDYKKKKNHNKI